MDLKQLTNEELVLLVQEGNNMAKEVLYNKNYGLIIKAIKKYIPFAEKRLITRDDLAQQAYIFFDKYVYKYDMNKCKFSTFLYYVIDKAMYGFINGTSSREQGNIKLELNTTSLDVPAGEDKESYIYELIEDKTCINSDDVIHKLYIQQIFKETIESIKDCMSETNFNIFMLHDYKGYSFKKVADILGLNPRSVNQRVPTIKDQLRKSKYIRNQRYRVMCRYLEELERKAKLSNNNLHLIDEIEQLKKTIALEKYIVDREEKKEEQKRIKELQIKSREEKKKKLQREILINNSALWLLDKLQ